MPSFSQHSEQLLATCDARLRDIFQEVIREVDCRVISGHRDMEEQNRLVREGKSQLLFPESYHNRMPSRAVDVVPYPVDWEDRERMTLFAGYVLGVASRMGHRLTWGGDWDRDFQVNDNKFDDFAHFQIEG